MIGPYEETPLARFIGKLEAEGCKPRRGSGNQWGAFCPSHDDSNPSLSIGEGEDGKVLLTCHADCSKADILARLDMTLADLFPSNTRHPATPRRRRSTEPPRLAEPTDDTFGFLPACLIDHPCIICMAVYAYLARRCGSDNRPQRGWQKLATRSASTLARCASTASTWPGSDGCAFVSITATGAYRSIEITLAHCPPLKIRNLMPALPWPTTPARASKTCNGCRFLRPKNRHPM